MLNRKLQFVFIAVMILEYFLMNTQYTNADIFDEEVIQNNQLLATTLSFSQQNTANNNTLSSLFYTNGLQTGGFDLAAVRIKKTGKMNFTYRIRTEETTPSILCKSLSLKVLYKGEFIYEGKLLDFVRDETLTQDNPQDWIYFLSLPTDASNVKLQSCDFAFRFKTWRGNPDTKKGFYDERILSNAVTSGNW